MENKKYVFLEVGGRDCQFLTNDNICVLDGDCENCSHGKTLDETKEIANKAICKELAKNKGGSTKRAIDIFIIGLKAFLGGEEK